MTKRSSRVMLAYALIRSSFERPTLTRVISIAIPPVAKHDVRVGNHLEKSPAVCSPQATIIFSPLVILAASRLLKNNCLQENTSPASLGLELFLSPEC